MRRRSRSPPSRSYAAAKPAAELQLEHLPACRLELTLELVRLDDRDDPVEALAVQVDDPEDVAEAARLRLEQRLPQVAFVELRISEQRDEPAACSGAEVRLDVAVRKRAEEGRSRPDPDRSGRVVDRKVILRPARVGLEPAECPERRQVAAVEPAEQVLDAWSTGEACGFTDTRSAASQIPEVERGHERDHRGGGGLVAADLELVVLRTLVVCVVDDPRREPEHAALDLPKRLQLPRGRAGGLDRPLAHRRPLHFNWSTFFTLPDDRCPRQRSRHRRRRLELPGRRPAACRGGGHAGPRRRHPRRRRAARVADCRVTGSSHAASASAGRSSARRSTCCAARASSTSVAGSRGGVFVRSLAIPTELLTGAPTLGLDEITQLLEARRSMETTCALLAAERAAADDFAALEALVERPRGRADEPGGLHRARRPLPPSHRGDLRERATRAVPRGGVPGTGGRPGPVPVGYGDMETAIGYQLDTHRALRTRDPERVLDEPRPPPGRPRGPLPRARRSCCAGRSPGGTPDDGRRLARAPRGAPRRRGRPTSSSVAVVALAYAAGERISIPDAERRGAARRALLLLAAGGDPGRGLDARRARRARRWRPTSIASIAAGALQAGLDELAPAGARVRHVKRGVACARERSRRRVAGVRRCAFWPRSSGEELTPAATVRDRSEAGLPSAAVALLVGIAFVAGMVTAISPCVLPVLPIVFAGSAAGGDRRPYRRSSPGSSQLHRLHARSDGAPVRARAAARTSSATSQSASSASSGCRCSSRALGRYLERPFAALGRRRPGDVGGGFLLGVSLGLLFTPCAGPIIAAVAGGGRHGALHASRPSLVTLAYALGAGVVLLGLALAARRGLNVTPLRRPGAARPASPGRRRSSGWRC